MEINCEAGSTELSGANWADDFSELVESGREPTREEIGRLLRAYFNGPIDDGMIARLDEQLRKLLADDNTLDAEGCAFRANGRRYLGQAWKELLSPHEHLPSAAELVVWLAVVTPGYPPPRAFCPPALVGTWRDVSARASIWSLDQDGTFQTTDSRIAHPDLSRWCVHHVERRGDFYRDRLWLLGNERHNTRPTPLIIRECTRNRLRLLRAGGDLGDEEYELERLVDGIVTAEFSELVESEREPTRDEIVVVRVIDPSSGVTARSRAEFLLYIEEHPCARCGTAVRPQDLVLDGSATEHGARYIYTGNCSKCAAPLRYEFEGPAVWPNFATFAYGDATPSSLFTAVQWDAMAARREREIAMDPGSLTPSDYYKSNGRILQARAMLDEAVKLGANPRTFDTRIAKLQKLKELYDSKSAEMEARYRTEVPAPPPRGTFTRESLKAHADWVARGKQGDGRLVLEGTGVGGLSLGNVKLQGSRLVRVSFDSARVDFAKFEGAELVECTAEKTNFAHTNFDGVVFERCKFTGAGMVLTDCNDATFTGGDFQRINADRGMWIRSRLRGVDFREARFGDCVLDAAVFEDCDFRGANFSRVTAGLKRLCSTVNATFRRCDFRGARFEGRRLNGTRFIDCKFAGVRGKPAIEGTYIVERPDFSAAGDGSDVLTDAAVFAIWGDPPR